MFDTMRVEPYCDPDVNCGSSYSWVYFVVFLMMCSLVMLNLFILVILQQFDEYYLPDDNVLDRFKADLETFKKAWYIHTHKYNCFKIKDRDLVTFFASMDPRLGMSNLSEVDIIRHLVLMDLESDEEGYIYFNDLLFKAMKRVYGCAHIKNMLLADAELRTLQKLQDLNKKMAKKSRVMERTSLNTVNPFLTRMFYRMTFRSWKNVMEKKADVRKEEIREQWDRSFHKDESSSEEIDEAEATVEVYTEKTIEEVEYMGDSDDDFVLKLNDNPSGAILVKNDEGHNRMPDERMGSRTLNSALSYVQKGKRASIELGAKDNDSDRKVDESSLLMH